MFQYALLRGVAAKAGFSVAIPHHRRANIWGFPITAGRLIDAELPKRTFRERRFAYCPEVFEQSDDTNFRGYFQTEKYFSHIAEEIRGTFRFSKQVSRKAGIISQLRPGGPVISVHVRRGDYVNNAAHFCLAASRYYENALEYFPTGTFAIISDDIDWCKTRFHGERLRFLYSGSVFVDLATMAQCDHHIISNSTFAWWGAWLNPSKEKRVLRPSRWWGASTQHLSDEDICPETWEKIPVE